MNDRQRFFYLSQITDSPDRQYDVSPLFSHGGLHTEIYFFTMKSLILAQDER